MIIQKSRLKKKKTSCYIMRGSTDHASLTAIYNNRRIANHAKSISLPLSLNLSLAFLNELNALIVVVVACLLCCQRTIFFFLNEENGFLNMK